MELLKSSIVKTVFEYKVFVEFESKILKYDVVVELAGTNQHISIYKSHYEKLTASEKTKIREYITSQFKIK